MAARKSKRKCERGKHHAATNDPQLPGSLTLALGQVSADRRHFQSTRALARLAERSPEHLSRELRRWTGKTPTDVINEARMTYASRALIESDDKIMTIALDCGIQNLGYFLPSLSTHLRHIPASLPASPPLDR